MSATVKTYGHGFEVIVGNRSVAIFRPAQEYGHSDGLRANVLLEPTDAARASALGYANRFAAMLNEQAA